MSSRPRSEEVIGSPRTHGTPRRHDSTTSVYPATGMSTYYSAGKRGSVRSSASSSPASPVRRPVSDCGRQSKDSPVSTVSSVSDLGTDILDDDMKNMTPKFRTVVKLSTNADRDKLFPNAAPGKHASSHGNGSVASGDEDVKSSPGVKEQMTLSHTRDTTANLVASSSLTTTLQSKAKPSSASRDSQRSATVTEHGQHTKKHGDKTLLNGTVSSGTETNMDINMASRGAGYSYDTSYNTPGSTNGIDSHDSGVPPIPPRNRKPSLTGGTRNHAQVNGSTGVASDLSDSLDSDTSSLNQDGYPYEKFHMDQQISTDSEGSLCNTNGYGTSDDGQGSEVELHPFLVGQRDILKPNEPTETKIISSKGTVRGLKNLVRAGIATFAEKKEGSKNFRQIDKGKVVVYTTSVMIVRDTYERCIQVKKILQTHMVKFEERDIFMSRENHRELSERLGTDRQDIVPQVFADGQHIGGFEDLERMNETGELRTIFKQFQRVCRTTSCAKCGGFSYMPCSACHGSKKSTNRNLFTEEFFALRCTNCDENGLVRCDLCFNEDVTS